MDDIVFLNLLNIAFDTVKCLIEYKIDKINTKYVFIFILNLNSYLVFLFLLFTFYFYYLLFILTF